MKQKELEILLSKLKGFEKPKLELEQYQTPARLVAMITFRAYMLGDIKNKTIMDLCCGTGLFAIAAKELGAERVYGVDIDKDALLIAQENEKTAQTVVDWINKDVLDVAIQVDTVFMNSPFGIQGSVKDQFFLKKAMELSKVSYSIHLFQDKNIAFLKKFIEKNNKTTTEIIKAQFEIPHIYSFHRKRYHVIDVAIIRSE